jgi:hypothetical protein
MTGPRSGAREHITSAIQHYLSLLQNRESDGVDRLAELARALDQLVMTYHATEDVGLDTEDHFGPRSDEQSYAEGAAAAFAELGWYALVEPDGDQDQEVGLSIATGDLAEIAVDLDEVLWLFDNASENDAIWQFRWGYQFHWGKHLHEIRVYLHSLAAW